METIQENAAKILTAFKNHRYGPPAWSADFIAHSSALPISAVRKALPGLLEAGELVAIREEWTVTAASLLYGTQSRANATYYVLPAVHEKLVRERDERVQKPVREQAHRIVLERHADEVETEFNRLWAEHQAASTA